MPEPLKDKKHPHPTNALTIDVEDNHRIVARNLLGKDGPPSEAVLRNTRRVLEHLGNHNVRGTFFVLGEVATTYPELVRAIVSGGHELGTHGFRHHEVYKLTPEEFRLLELVSEGKPKQTIASALGRCVRTVEVYQKQLMTKIGVDSLLELVRFAVLACDGGPHVCLGLSRACHWDSLVSQSVASYGDGDDEPMSRQRPR